MSTGWIFNPQPPRPGWGVHLPTFKKAPLRHPITVAPLPAQATISLRFGGGIEVPALVRLEERVLTGQPIARDADGLTVHASITGIVTAIGPQPVAATGGSPAPCVVIRREEPEQWHESCEPVAASLLSPAEICAHIAAGGIAGLGGAVFPTGHKLASGGAVRGLIVNGAECEPWIACDEALMRERAGSVVNGTRIMMRALGTAQAVIAVESNMPEARVALDAALRETKTEGIGIAVVTAKYPAGGERQLIELVTGEEVPSGGLPRDCGFVCHNVGTAAAVGEWFYKGRPLVSRIVTITGSAVAGPANMEARIGTPIRELIEQAGGYADTPACLLMGGPMMGLALPDDSLPVTKASNCIVAAAANDVAQARPEMSCIRCGECIQVCPARLLPQELLSAARRGDRARLAGLGLADCIECGCCDYVCPSHIRLTARFAAAKEAPS